MSGLALDLEQTLETSIRAAERILLFLDFDGTLSPIVARPELAALDERSRKALEALLRFPRVAVAVVSGRALDDLRSRVGLPVIYAGNHGLEIQGPDFAFRTPGLEKALAAFDVIESGLAGSLRHIPGVLIEHKGLAVSVHFRLAAPAQKPEVERIVEEACRGHLDAVRLRAGKEIVEIRPAVDWDKGTAARWIRDRLGARGWPIVCAGDDLTDEDMFVALPDAVSIKVGAGPTMARFRVADTGGLSALLERVAAAMPRAR
ncbi:MAG: trehalose-phosphatase [Bryobacteraceae bacterium]